MVESDSSMHMILAKTWALVLLFYLAYLAIICPCNRLWSCHETGVWVAICLLVIFVLWENGLPRFLGGSKDSSCPLKKK